MRKSVLAAMGVGVLVAAGAALVIGGDDGGPGEAPSYTVPEQIERFSTGYAGTGYTDLVVTDMDGGEHRLEDINEALLVVNLWATWCPPCVAEMPALQRMHEALAGSGVAVAAVSVDREGAEKVRPFLEETGITTLPIYLDPESRSLRVFKAGGLPTTVVLDADGRELGRVIGPAEWDAAAVVDFLKGLAQPQ